MYSENDCIYKIETLRYYIETLRDECKFSINIFCQIEMKIF